jgi:uncharacterized protein YpbB
MEEIEINIQFEQVLRFVNQTSQNIFLTGKAGTGKTTLLRHIRKHTYKRMAVVAPTGVAAINAGGSTIHSFFQFAFNPYVPNVNSEGELIRSSANLPVTKYNSQRLAIIRNLELLVIDEVSMVRADLLDQIDATLRHVRRRWELPFGGVQVLLIGDMFQLPPVVQNEEWTLLKGIYESPFFFDSKVIRKDPPVFIELDKIYRQKEQTFVDLLNKVRNNQMGPADLELLNKKFNPSLSKKEIAEYVTLTTHNRKADELNESSLNAIKEKEYSFKCTVEDLFNEKNYPAEDNLRLKKGARVMFLRNNPEKNYYNGKTGVVTFIDNEKIKVKCEEDRGEIEVPKETWKNISYKVDASSKQINEEVMGTFTQYPLRLAWAITIHKSQGLTFDKLIIDAAEAFSSGQVYVALSRCRSLEGLVLSSKISSQSLFNDKKVMHFSSGKHSGEQINGMFQNAQSMYMRGILMGLFDLTEAKILRGEIAGLVQLYKGKLAPNSENWTKKYFDKIDSLSDVASKFQNQLRSLSDSLPQIEQNAELMQRVAKASAYFIPEIENCIQLLKECELRTENKEASTEISSVLQESKDLFYTKKQLINSCKNGFVFQDLIAAKMKLNIPEESVNIYSSARNTKISSDTKNPVLFKRLMLVRDKICNEDHLSVTQVVKNETIKQLAEFLPTQTEQLLKIKGFGKIKAEMFGARFIFEIKKYIEENDLEEMDLLEDIKIPKSKLKSFKADPFENMKVKPAKGDSAKETLRLFKEGKKFDEIAKERKMAVSTVESHLSRFISAGDLDIDAVISKEKQEKIRKALKNYDQAAGITPIKQKLSSDISFSEIRWMLSVNKGQD